MAADPRITLSIDDRGRGGSVARVVVDSEARLNILGSVLIKQFISALESLRENTTLRAVVVTGAGDRAFIGGADINEMSRLDQDTARGFITDLHRACLSIRSLPVPVIARISGYCLGAGLEIAAACDLRVASMESTFGMPEVRVGIPSVIEAALLPQLIGWGKTRELLYTGERITAEEAVRIGLVERATSLDQLDTAVSVWIDSICKAGHNAIKLQKALIQEWEQLSPEKAIERGIDYFAEAFKGGEPRFLMSRFLKRAKSKTE
ncbi:MAG: enoyl-CoA hydratase [Blastocatellia bacterium AA13]|nr:MAG: enoyl-CoA hydratase [Blastocatellia bacterium AA13]